MKIELDESQKDFLVLFSLKWTNKEKRTQDEKHVIGGPPIIKKEYI